MAMMERRCLWCEESFSTERSTARWCSERCRKRAQRAGFVVDAEVDESPRPAIVALAVERELEQAGVLDTILGCQALLLAATLDETKETGPAVAASKELRVVMRLALAARAPVADEVDELRAARDRKRAAARS